MRVADTKWSGGKSKGKKKRVVIIPIKGLKNIKQIKKVSHLTNSLFVKFCF